MPWSDPRPDFRQRLVRAVLGKKRQGRPSPAGLGQLPFELLDLIFKKLCGREIHSVRLVSSEWEVASRPFFAASLLSRSVFWLTSSSLNMLDSLSCKFGPYIGIVYIAVDHFTLSGLARALKQYLRYRYWPHLAARYDLNEVEPSLSKFVLEDKSRYIGQWFRQDQWHTYWNRYQTMRFFWSYLCNIISQACLYWSKRDLVRMERILIRMPACDIKAVSLDYEPEQLVTNAHKYGKPAPEHGFELALYCSGKHLMSDGTYFDHVERVVAEAVERRRLLMPFAS